MGAMLFLPHPRNSMSSYMINSIWDWVCGNGQWKTLLDCLGHDRAMTYIVLVVDGIIFALMMWICHYWRKFISVAKEPQSVVVLKNLYWIFFWCAVCGFGFRVLKYWYPAWRLWAFLCSFLVYHCIRFVFLMHTGFVVVFQNYNTLRQLRECSKFAETSQMELSALREKLCEVKTLIGGRRDG